MPWSKIALGVSARLAALGYDSGRRRLALPEGVTGHIYVQRVGRWVTITVGNTSPVPGDLIVAETLPATLSPENAFGVLIKGGELSVSYAGEVRLIRPDGRYGAGVVTYLARSAGIPTTLPGTAA